MTDVHPSDESDGPHEGPIKTPRQLILAVFFSFVVPVFGIVLLVLYVTTAPRPQAGSASMTPEAIAERLRPVGHVEIKDLGDLAAMKTGEQVFAGQCTSCHAAGLLGAPKLGDIAAWAPRIKTGYDALLHSALAGKGQMPPQGGGEYGDFEIGRAVVYMANKGGASFAEPVFAAASAVATATAEATTAPAAAVATVAAASGPAADANAGTPAANPTTALNAQVRDAAPTAPAGGTAPAAAAAVAAAGAAPALYGQICFACHAQGVSGAPKLGDKAAWAPRIALGVDALTASAIHGKGAMPPKGGSTASEAEIKAVVTYMVSQAR